MADVVKHTSSRPGYRPSPFAFSYLLLVLTGATLVALFYWGIVSAQRIPVLAPSFDERQNQARLEALKVALTTTAGLGAAAGFYVGYRRQKTQEENSYREQDRVFTERFTVASNLLAHESAAVRLAGVNSLARLSDDSARDRDTCLRTLCSYLRIPVEISDANPSAEQAVPKTNRSLWRDPNEWDVRRSALALVAARLQPAWPAGHWKGSVDLRDAILIDADFTGCLFASNADFGGATLNGAAKFQGVDFCDATSFDFCIFTAGADFTDSRFYVEATFDSAVFSEMAKFELSLSSDTTPSLMILPSYRAAKFLNGLVVSIFLKESIRMTTRRLNFEGAVLCGDVSIPGGLSHLV
ncbi:MAG: pentapeptide repeat-containing protein [Pseudonocardiaceae bacterium]